MLASIALPEAIPLGLPGDCAYGAEFAPIQNVKYYDASPRTSSGPSACSVASR